MSGESQSEIELRLWASYMRERDQNVKGKLVDLYLPLAKIIAARLYGRRVNNDVAFDDYHQYARLGLLEAIDNFNPERGFKFNTYADSRISGSVLSGLEFQTEKLQQVSMVKRLKRERLESCKKTLKKGQDGKVDKDDIFKTLAEIGVGMALGWLLDDTGMTRSLEETFVESPFYRSIELRQLQSRILESIQSLADQEAKFIRYHYFQGISMGEIAEIFAVSGARVSQINRSALAHLKTSLGDSQWSGISI